MTLQELINEYKNQTGFSNEFLAKELGVSRSTVSRWAKGEIKNIQDETMERLSNLIGFDVKEKLKSVKLFNHKPILGYAKAGYDLFAEENYQGMVEVTDDECLQGDFFLHVIGDSMEGAHIHDGDLAYIKQCCDVDDGTIAVVLVGNEVTIKRVLREKGLFILAAANPDVPDRYFTQEETEMLPIKILGKVIYTKTVFD